MKKIILIYAMSVFLTLTSLSQTEQNTISNIFPIAANGEIIYSEKVDVDSIKSTELYVRAHEWFAKTFKSAQSVIQLDDKEAGKILGKGSIQAGIAQSHAGVTHPPV
jgi:hypothetical protein